MTLRAPSPLSRTKQSEFGRGFTLIELLVVMTLLSIIMVGLVSALRTMAQTESKIDQRLNRLDEIRVARSFLQQTLSRVSSSLIDAPGATGQKVIPFEALTNSLTWIGVMPARPDVGGRYFFKLAVETQGVQRELVLRFTPWQPDGALPDWSRADYRVLVAGIETLKIEAEGLAPQARNPAHAWPKGWQNGWPVTDILPERIRLRLEDAQGPWPEWTLPLHAMSQSDGSFSIVVIGGSR